MSQATRATSARQRATIAARYIRAGQTSGRALADCFEMWDGSGVVGHLVKRAETCPKIRDYATRAGWLPLTLPVESEK